MKKFKLPKDLIYNTEAIKDPTAFFNQSISKSWLCLTGDEFARMENGMSYEQVQAATLYSINVVSDPPYTLNLDLPSNMNICPSYQVLFGRQFCA